MKAEQITDSISSILENESFSVTMLDHVALDAKHIYKPDYNLILFVTKGNVVAKIEVKLRKPTKIVSYSSLSGLKKLWT